MKIKIFLLVGLMFSAVLLPALGADERDSQLPQTVLDVRYESCSLMGGKALENVATMHEGKVYHFCCGGCISGFNKNPSASITKIKDPKEVSLNISNVDGNCPVTGEAAKSDVFLVRSDAITFYCCAGCIGKDKLDAPNAGNNKSDETHKDNEHEGCH